MIADFAPSIALDAPAPGVYPSLVASAAPNAAMTASRNPLDGVVAQLGERLNGIQEVDSSILFGSTTTYPQVKYIRCFLAMIGFGLAGKRCSAHSPSL